MNKEKIKMRETRNISTYWNTRKVVDKANEVLTICNVRGQGKYQDITYSQAKEIISEIKYEWIYGIRRDEIEILNIELKKFINDVEKTYREKK